MHKQVFPQGAFLFQEGDAVNGVYKIHSGSVDVLRERNAAAIVLGTVGPGQHLGEMGVLEGRSFRSAAARAATDVEAELLPANTFIDEIARSPDGACEMIVRLSRRLHTAEDRIVSDERPHTPNMSRDRGLGAHVGIAGVTLTAATAELGEQLGQSIDIKTTPFLVGREPIPGEHGAALKVNLRLLDQQPFRLSRDHFAIVFHNGQLYVQDLRSTLGTTVNGHPIGDHFGQDEAPLQIGNNEIIAGGIASPFIFTIRVSEIGT